MGAFSLLALLFKGNKNPHSNTPTLFKDHIWAHEAFGVKMRNPGSLKYFLNEINFHPFPYRDPVSKLALNREALGLALRHAVLPLISVEWISGETCWSLPLISVEWLELIGFRTKSQKTYLWLPFYNVCVRPWAGLSPAQTQFPHL